MIMLFTLHVFWRDNNVDIWRNRKSWQIIDNSTCLLREEKRKAWGAVHSFFGNDYSSSVFRKEKKVLWKLVLQSDEFVDAYSRFDLFDSVAEDVHNTLENFVSWITNYNNKSDANKFRVKWLSVFFVQTMSQICI